MTHISHIKVKFLKLIFVLTIINLLSINAFTQQQIWIHSHNDYKQLVPFYQAYAQQVASIEADIFAQNGELLVAHDTHELATAQTLDELYIEPLVKLFKLNGNKAWKNSDNTLTLLIDLKTATTPTLDILIQKLSQYPNVFDSHVNPFAVRIVISGNRPAPNDFEKYPNFIFFDGDKTDYTLKQLARIAMISFSLGKYSEWNGKGSIKREQLKKIQKLIDGVHKLGKPIRFWAAPDGVTAWNTLHNLGVDYINTDRPEACAYFFNNFENKNYAISSDIKGVSNEVNRAKNLDKTTVGFQGFNNKLLQLSKTIDVYQPTYLNDGASNKPIKNVIFLIGDGMSLAQLQVAAMINSPGQFDTNGLSILNIKHVGLQNTSAKDSYTTDSAAGGSALATGEIHSNRHISISDKGIPYPSLTDIAYIKGMACGVVTLGNVADATPSAFYGHATERDNSDEITTYLTEGKLSILSGAGMSVFTDRKDGRDLLEELKSQYEISDNIESVDARHNKKIICIDERMDLAVTEATLGLLAETTTRSIEKLSNKKGFFLMVEGAKIDYAGHANSLPGSIMETLSFDLAVASALKFADSNGETLVIVTGDHETGGLTLVDGIVQTGHITARYMTDDHTPLMLPVFAYGAGASKFIGVYKNTAIFHKIKELLDGQ